jgi:hypothetical protein
VNEIRGLAERRPFAVALFLALVLLLVPYRALLGPGVPSGRDLVPYFYPLKVHLAEAVRAGEMRERTGTAAIWGAGAVVVGLLAAPVLGAYLVTGLENVRGTAGALRTEFAEQGALPAARLAELLADGVVADWTTVSRTPEIPSYPYFPSLTPGRVAWTLALAGLFAGRGARLRGISLVATRDSTIDGRPAAVEDANVGFTGLIVPAGRHLVRLQPSRTWLMIATMIFALGLVATAVLLRPARHTVRPTR